ncbi:matrixin family metalloprotease [Streptomyces sp. NPDC059452]|uniref:matrixin family metalloprotease n=1 Tax=Streptomyces sp. NPDC059452 TaxID=3346835 RepID=UPI0036AD7A27
MQRASRGALDSAPNPASEVRRRSVVAWSALPSVLIAFALVMTTGAPAGAYNTYNGHRLKYGINGEYYWLDSTAQNSHPNAIPAGVGHWNNTTDTKVWYVKTLAKEKSRLDFYRRSSSSGVYCAATSMYVNTSAVNAYQKDWVWAKVTIDPLLANASQCGPETHRDGIIAHEVGHAMGLDHNSNKSSLMYTNISGTRVDAPIKDDRNGINHLY